MRRGAILVLILVLVLCALGVDSSASLPHEGIAVRSLRMHYRRGKTDPVPDAPILANSPSGRLPYASAPRSRLIPIYQREVGKFASLSLMMLSIVFIFTLTRDTKDVLLVASCGAESISFLKVYGVLPAAALFMVIYGALSASLSPSALFYAVLTPFIAFFLSFAFVLYPLRDALHPLHWNIPAGGAGYAVNLLRYWTYSLYYIVSELWGSVGVPLLFWSCANDVVTLYQARRMYPMMSVLGNLGPVLAGILMSTIADRVRRLIPNDEAAFEATLKILAGVIAGAGMVTAGLHVLVRHLHSQEPGPPCPPVSQPSTPQPAPTRLSLRQSFALVFQDAYLRQLAVMVIAFNICMEFTETLWKSAVRAALPEKTEYLAFMGRYSTLVGATAFLAILVGPTTSDARGWRAGAFATPLVMGALAAPLFLLLRADVTKEKVLLGAVYVGLVQNVVSKAVKYAMFDPVKEMAYIPLESRSRHLGKAAVDVLGARVGKTGAALVQQTLVLVCGSLFSSSSYLAGLFYLVLLVWTRTAMVFAASFERKSANVQAPQS